MSTNLLDQDFGSESDEDATFNPAPQDISDNDDNDDNEGQVDDSEARAQEGILDTSEVKPTRNAEISEEVVNEDRDDAEGEDAAEDELEGEVANGDDGDVIGNDGDEENEDEDEDEDEEDEEEEEIRVCLIACIAFSSCRHTC